MIRRIISICLLGLIFGLPAQVLAATVVLVLSESGKVHQEFAGFFSAALQRTPGPPRLVVTDLTQLDTNALNTADLLVAVGSRAAEALITRESATPLLLSMLPRSLYDRLKTQNPRAGGVFIDQPPARYINLIRIALPEHGHVGLLAGRDGKGEATRLLNAAREQRLRAQSESVADESEIFPALQKLFAEGGVLLATPDSSIFNARTLPSILMGAFHRQIPVIGFSPAYVGAGATLALYSSPEQLASQTADISRAVLGGANMPAGQYPRQYTIGINERVARSLGLNLDTATSIKERLEKMERQP